MYLGHAVAWAVSNWPVTAEAWVHTKVSECGIYGGLSDLGAGFSASISFLLLLLFHLCIILIQSCATNTVTR
jgi:hypothetical protein